METVVHTNGR